MTDELGLAPAPGFIDPELQAEFPSLRLDWVTVQCRPRASPPSVRDRLRRLSDRYRGASVIAMRTQPIPHAYRSFFHQVGLDPDSESTRVPSEEVAVMRLLHGGFRSAGLIPDALLIALVETGVPVWALNADRVDTAGPGIRTSRRGERLGSDGHGFELPPGRLVVADARQIHAVLFGELAPGNQVTPRTSRVALFAVGVDGVPAIHVEEAIWLCLELLGRG
jgi:DNA/RNA-binding domain of Phe-tRNA-synthetase-like protein